MRVFLPAGHQAARRAPSEHAHWDHAGRYLVNSGIRRARIRLCTRSRRERPRHRYRPSLYSIWIWPQNRGCIAFSARWLFTRGSEYRRPTRLAVTGMAIVLIAHALDGDSTPCFKRSPDSTKPACRRLRLHDRFRHYARDLACIGIDCSLGNRHGRAVEPAAGRLELYPGTSPPRRPSHFGTTQRSTVPSQSPTYSGSSPDLSYGRQEASGWL